MFGFLQGLGFVIIGSDGPVEISGPYFMKVVESMVVPLGSFLPQTVKWIVKTM